MQIILQGNKDLLNEISGELMYKKHTEHKKECTYSNLYLLFFLDSHLFVITWLTRTSYRELRITV